MQVDLFITDLDGTILRPDDTISKTDLEAIKDLKKANIKIAIATGRAVAVSQYLIEQIKPDFFIGLNGAIIFKPESNEVIQKICTPKIIAQKVIDILETNNLFYFICAHNGMFYTDRYKNKLREAGLRDAFLDKFENLFKTFDINDLDNIEIGTFFVETANENKTKIFVEAMDTIEEMSYAATKLTGYDLIPRGVDKGTAIKKLCQVEGIDLKNTVGIGDSENDLSMFNVVGKGIAVENALEHVKKAVSVIVSSNENNGIAHAASLILNNKL